MYTGIPHEVSKPWGKETWLANNEEENYCSKILHIDANEKTSMHFHVEKHETFYVWQGTLIVQLLDTKTCNVECVTVEKGQTLEIDRLKPHQLKAHHGDVILIETSTYHRDSDSYRVWMK